MKSACHFDSTHPISPLRNGPLRIPHTNRWHLPERPNSLQWGCQGLQTLSAENDLRVTWNYSPGLSLVDHLGVVRMSNMDPQGEGLFARLARGGNGLNFDWPAKTPNSDFRMSALPGYQREPANPATQDHQPGGSEAVAETVSQSPGQL